MDYEKKEVTIKRGCLQSPSPKVGPSSQSILYPHGGNSAFLGIMDFAIFPEVRAKDKPAASFFLRKFNLYHRQTELNTTGMLTSEPVAELQQKTQSAGLWDKSLAQEQMACCCKDFLPECPMDFEFSRCKDKQNIYS